MRRQLRDAKDLRPAGREQGLHLSMDSLASVSCQGVSSEHSRVGPVGDIRRVRRAGRAPVAASEQGLGAIRNGGLAASAGTGRFVRCCVCVRTRRRVLPHGRGVLPHGTCPGGCNEAEGAPLEVLDLRPRGVEVEGHVVRQPVVEVRTQLNRVPAHGLAPIWPSGALRLEAEALQERHVEGRLVEVDDVVGPVEGDDARRVESVERIHRATLPARRDDNEAYHVRQRAQTEAREPALPGLAVAHGPVHGEGDVPVQHVGEGGEGPVQDYGALLRYLEAGTHHRSHARADGEAVDEDVGGAHLPRQQVVDRRSAVLDEVFQAHGRAPRVAHPPPVEDQHAHAKLRGVAVKIEEPLLVLLHVGVHEHHPALPGARARRWGR
mmetsp:Transcript_6548/g.19416  ORF Transcript_6548/g.19416 Transcript_6548/m.19416 type:complete len:379 (-) Transcript_6548:449-1585(-)